MKICVLDSGYDYSLLKKYDSKISGINFTSSKNDCRDEIGHGTAIIDTILKVDSHVEIIMCKIFEDRPENDELKLIQVLEYIQENLDFDILHMSFGISGCEQYKKLKKICSDFIQKGVIIVSAFDNMGSISYPAAFNDVIGVDSCRSSYTKGNYIYIEGSIVNIELNVGMRRIKIDNKVKIFKGSSFSAAYITGLIVKYLNNGVCKTGIMDELKKNAARIIEFSMSLETDRAFCLEKKINNTIIFPFNKEMHSLVRYYDMLPFNIVDIYDLKHGGKVGRSTNDILQNIPNVAKNYVIQDYLNINWTEDFDTVILGHVNQTSNMLKIDLVDYFIEKATLYSKKLFCFDQRLSVNSDSIYFSNIDKRIFKDTYGKYHQIVAPVLGIFGTSSSQGKFSLQLELRKMLIKDGFHVGQLGTEPQSALFGFDYTFPFGYGAKNDLDDISQSLLINNMLGSIDHQEVDLIVCGSQSGTIPYELNNSIQSTFPQMVFAQSIKPDVSVVCINPYDEVEYILRTIKFLESIVGNYVLGLVLFPINKEFSTMGITKIQLLNKCDQLELSHILQKALNKKIFTMDAEGIEALYVDIINYLK